MVETGVPKSTGQTKRTQDSPLRGTVKYKSYSKSVDPLSTSKWTPSQLLLDVTQPCRHAEGWRPKPQIIELLIIGDYTHQVQCAVGTDEPIFQPFPPEVVLHSYEPFKQYQATLSLRNNDKVARRVRVEPASSSYITVQRQLGPGKDEGTKVAAGMEASYVITFRPDSTNGYEQELVIATEREKFIVPVVAVGAAPALDVPDVVKFPVTPAKKDARQALLVQNVGKRAGGFALRAIGPFTVAPARGFLAPGETLQLALEFAPPSSGLHEGELEVMYDTGRTTYTRLRGEGCELDVSLSTQELTFLPTYMSKLSQKSFRIVNSSDLALTFAIKAHDSAKAEMATTSAALAHLTEQQQRHQQQQQHIPAFWGAEWDGRSNSSKRSSRQGSMRRNSPGFTGLPVLGPDKTSQGEADVSMDLDREGDGDSILGDAQLAATRQSKRARREITADKQLFHNPHFALFPSDGTVWPHSEMEVIAQFQPDHARDFECTAYVEVQGLGDRVLVRLFGRGVGAQAVFSYDSLDIGNAFINTVHEYEVELQNRGKVDAEYCLQPCHTQFGSKFSFAPEVGVLPPGQVIQIHVKLLSDALGSFEESFHWLLKGSSVPVTLTIKGQVVAPSFELDVQQLDYGIVSYGFRYIKEVMLSNMSAIPLTFSWRLAQDTPTNSEFVILPAKGTVLPNGKQKLTLEFLPQTVQKYNLSLVMDLPGISDCVASIPVTGECAVPLISLKDAVVDFGQCYLQYPYRNTLTLVNESKLPAKFEVVPQDNQSRCLATFTAEPSAATIPAKGQQTITLVLLTARLGRIMLPVYVRVVGSRNKPLQMVIDARSVGPTLEFTTQMLEAASEAAAGAASSSCGEQVTASDAAGDTAAASTVGTSAATGRSASPTGAQPAHGSSDRGGMDLKKASGRVTVSSKSNRSRGPSAASGEGAAAAAAEDGVAHLIWSETAAVKFEKVAVLQQHVRELRIHNPTLIPAQIHMFIEGKDSSFEVEPREAELAPGAEYIARVSVYLDDAQTFKDTLHVLVADGADVVIPVEATGVGFTVVSDDISPDMDFGHQFVEQPFQREVVVSNMGRRTVQLTWANSRLDEVLKAMNKTARGTGKKYEVSDIPPDQAPVFSITPDKIMLGAKESTTFLIQALATKPGVVSEGLSCMATATGGAKGSNKVFDAVLHAEVACPLLDFSLKYIEFSYLHVKGSKPEVMLQPLNIRNVSKLPLSFSMKAPNPFSLDTTSYTLQPDEAATIAVSFDPDFKHDMQSQLVKHKLSISYSDNPQKDSLELVGSIEFPNLQLEAQQLDFGCVLMDTTRRLSLGLTNPRKAHVNYSWAWLKQEFSDPALESIRTTKAAQGPPASQLFDILPIHGSLAPGESARTEFSFFAHPGAKVSAVAVCRVEEGPAYQVTLLGESNSIKYNVEPQFFDCGIQPYDKHTERDLYINNQGHVPFDFSVDLSKLSRPGIIEASPLSGKVAAGDKAHVKLKVLPGVPDRLMELVLVAVAHFEPVQVQVLVEGTYPVLLMNLPRVKDELFNSCVAAAQERSDTGLQVTTVLTLGAEQPRASMLGAATAHRSSVMAAPGMLTSTSNRPGSGTNTIARSTGVRPSSGAKSMISAVSGGSTVKTRASMAMSTMSAKDKLAQVEASLSAERRLEFEAERLRLVQLLLGAATTSGATAAAAVQPGLSNTAASTSQPASRNTRRISEPIELDVGAMKQQRSTLSSPAPKPMPGATSLLAAIPSSIAGTVADGGETAGKGAARTRRPPQAPKLPDLWSAHYLLDFGFVTKGINKSRKVKLTNTSTQTIAFVMDKQTLEQFGFSMVPEANIKLAGAPECQSQDITITIMSNRPIIQPGPVEVTLPLLIKGGLPVLLTVRAMVVVPDVMTSQPSLDFGTVTTGHCKVYTIQLTNSRQVPADWSIKKPAVDSPKLKDWQYFVAQPSEGVIEPGGATNIRVAFTPTLGHDSQYSLTLPIKVANNAKGKDLACSGIGYIPRIQFNPSLVDCGSILPLFPGQKPAEAALELTNTGGQAVEVVCLDTDTRYLADEEALRGLDRYDESGVALLRPLAPGDPLWPELLEEAAHKKSLEAAAAEAATQQGVTPMEVDAAAVASSTVATANNTSQGVGELEAINSTGAAAAVAPHQTPCVDSKPIVLLYGPPMAGTSTQARLLAERYDVPVVTVDTLLQEAVLLPPPSPSAAEASTDAADSAPAEPQSMSSSQYYEPDLAALLISKLVGDPVAVAAGTSTAPDVSKLQPQEAQDLVLRGLKQALGQEQYSRGFIVDGLGSRYLPAATSARCLLQAAGLRLKAAYNPEPPAPAAPAGRGVGATLGAVVNRKPAKSAQEAPAVEGPKADTWEGTLQLHAVELQLPKSTAACRLAVAAQATAAGLETGDVDMTGSEQLLEASYLEQTSQGQAVSAGAAGSDLNKDGSSASHEDPAFESSWQAHQSDAASLGIALGALQPSNRPIHHRVVSAEGGHVAVAQAVVGISFNQGQVQSVLPLVEADQQLVPPPYVMRIVQRPRARSARTPLTKFKVLTVTAGTFMDETIADSSATGSAMSASGEARTSSISVEDTNQSQKGGSSRPGTASGSGAKKPPAASANGASAASKPPGKAGGKATSVVEVPPPEPEDKRGLREMTRWVIPPNGKVQLVVQFQSDQVGKFNHLLGFDVVCGDKGSHVVLAGTCDFPRISTECRNVYYKTAKVRPQTPQVKQQYILSSSMFEFGPLLSGRDRIGYQQGLQPEHTAKFRITNNGLFDLHADFWLKSEGDPTTAATASDGKARAPSGTAGRPSVKAGGAAQPAPFILSPAAMDLRIDETQELCVYAFPPQEGKFEDVVMCRIKDNPTPVEFPISVIGARPMVTVTLDDTHTSLNGDTAVAAAAATGTKGAAARKGPKAKVEAPAADYIIQFDRLLLTKRDVKAFTISNPGVLPIKWRLVGADVLPPEFKVWPAAGELAARSDIKVTVEFNATQKKELSELIKLEVLDVQELLGVSHTIPIAIKGEAYKIEVDIKFPQEEVAGVDFGSLRVVDDCMKPLVIKNSGKYDVTYKFAVNSATVQELVTISPEEGVIVPGKDATIQLHWNKARKLRHEVTCAGITDIQLSIIEPLTASKEQIIPLKLTVNAQFSKYAITPARGLHFGPHTYSTSSKPRTFEIANLGEFPFTYNIFPLKTDDNPPAAPQATKGAKAAAAGTAAGADGKSSSGVNAKKNAPTGPPPGAVQLGQFILDPAEAVIQPGARQEVSVVFKADGSASYTATAGINITERDFTDQPAGIPYELGGESVIPGIAADNVGAIFEEHVVVNSLDPFNPVNNSFGLKEKVFNFGTLIAHLSEPGVMTPPPAEVSDSGQNLKPEKSARGKAAAAKEAAKAAEAAAVAAAAAAAAAATAGPAASTSPVVLGPSDEELAVKANLKFINPVKVPCSVVFSIKPCGTYPPGQTFPMAVHPSRIIIPPHEYRYVTLAFCPRAIRQYSASFEAVVEGGSDPATKSFTCEVRGEGTLPSLTLQEPSVFDPSGRPWLKFPRLMRGRTSRLLINVRNNGVMPASARLEMEPHAAFKLLEGPQAFSVDSKKAATFTVDFTPPDLGNYSHELQLRVHHNPFENYRIAMTGECAQEDVTMQGLPGDSRDELMLGDTVLGKSVSHIITLVNHTDAKHFRFKWPDHPQLKFVPAIGHLHAGKSKEVTVTFSSTAPVKLDGQDVKMQTAQINYKSGEPVEWDDVIAAAAIAARSVTGAGNARTSSMGANLGKPGAEPPTDTVPKSQKDIVLKVRAVADNAKYNCPAAPILFRPTMMFQTRCFSFPLGNTGLAALHYNWRVLTTNHELDNTGLYTVTPESGTVPGGQAADITVRFSPQEVEDCSRLIVCDIPDLDPSCSPLRRPVSGKVLRPWCHFELPESDYVSAGRRNPEMPGPSGAIEPLDAATKVVEFESLGVRVRNTKRFFVLNPTSISYEFSWAPLNAANAAAGLAGAQSPFVCTTRKGTIDGGRRYEMVFEYTPLTDCVSESFWVFSIPGQAIHVPFLLVGLVSEPRVMFDVPAINFGQVQLGVKGKQVITLFNDEHIPFHYSLDRSSYDATDELVASTGKKPALEITPVSGSIPPNSKVELTAVFAPQFEKTNNHSVICRIRNKPTPLVLNVKGEGYALKNALLLEMQDGKTLELSDRGVNEVDFGQVIINDRVIRALHLVNSGTVNFDFVWDLGAHKQLGIRPEAGSVPTGERLVCELDYHPTAVDKLDGCKATCQVVNGPKYVLSLSGSGYKPRLNLNFHHHDFGPVHVWQQGMDVTKVVLHARNDDKQQCSFDVHCNPNAEHLQVDCGSTVLASGESKDIPILFRPTSAMQYKDTIQLEINGLYTINITTSGEGVPLLVGLADPGQRTVAFGAVPKGQSSSRVLVLANRGKAAAAVSLAPSVDMFARLGLEVMPAGLVLLRPRETSEVTLYFRPPGRTHPFSEELIADVAGVRTTLAQLTGACTGTELSLASDSLPFGTVVLGSRTSKRLQLSNTGDVGTKFVWETKALGPNFTIYPAEGFLALGQDVKLEVTFHPTTTNPDIRVERLRCKVDGTADMLLTLTGACVASTAMPEVVTFKCNVRSSCSKSITLHNTSSSAWQLHPVIQNNMWSGPEFLKVPAAGKAEYNMTYKPVTMSGPDTPHEGSVFFPIPDGTGLLYRLAGQAENPTPEAVIERSLAAKTQHCEVLKVTNWLSRPQRFKVITSRNTADVATKLEGPEYIDVPALCDKEYKLNFYSYTQGVTAATVTFKNESSGEYVYYELKFSCSAVAPRGALLLECPVRTQTSTKVSITNPLKSDIAMKANINNKQVTIVPAAPVLRANTTTDIEVRYRPLLVAPAEGVLKLECPELGSYEWQLRLSGTATNPERTLGFSVPLGNRETQVFRFTHWLPEKTEYKCFLKSSGSSSTSAGTAGFDAPASVTAPAAAGPGSGSEVELEVGFEPSAIGESLKDTLVVSSAVAGEYHIPLVGRCVPPKPQGPIELSKSPGQLSFKNVFCQEAEFLFSVDNPAFVLAKTSERLAAKKSTTIAITFKPEAVTKAAAAAVAAAPLSRMGKLTVSCPKQTSSQWVFYLQA